MPAISITIRQHQSRRNQIEAIPEGDWTLPLPYWMDGAADVAETTYIPFESAPGRRAGAAHRPPWCSPRPVLNWPSWSTTAITASSPTGTEALWNWRHSGTGGRSSPPRRDRERHPRPQVRRGTQPSPLRAFRRQVPLQSTAWLAVQVMAHNLAHWAARIGLGEQLVTTKTLRRRFFSIAGRLTRSARRRTRHLPQRWPWENQFTHAWARVRAVPLPA